jgi:hypothetical protein
MPTPAYRVWISKTPAGPAIHKKYDRAMRSIDVMEWFGKYYLFKPSLDTNTMYYLNIKLVSPHAESSDIQRNISNI